MGRDSPYRMPLAGKEDDPVLAARLSAIPYRARRAALAAGLEPLLSRILQEKVEKAEKVEKVDKAGGADATLSLGAMQEELTLRLVAFDAQVSAATFEAGCTAEMIRKLLAELADREQSRQLSLTVASLVLGAVAGTVAGVWSLSDDQSRVPAVLGIAGGVTTTALGAAALLREDHVIAFDHPQNRLAPIWHGADPDHLYPSFVFRMLTYPDDDAGATPQDQLVAAWEMKVEQAFPAAHHGCARQTLLGDGGRYDEVLLALRAEMFAALESAVRGVARDLELLNRALVRALSRPYATRATSEIQRASATLEASR